MLITNILPSTMTTVLPIKWPLAFLLWATLSALSFGQKLFPLQRVTDSMQIVVLPGPGGLLTLQITPGSFVYDRGRDYPLIQQLRLQESDLLIEYQPPTESAGRSYSLEVYIRSEQGDLFLPSYYALKTVESGNVRQLVWRDIAEALLDPTQTYFLCIRRAQMGAVNCEGPRPEFTLKKRLPYFGAATAGVALVGVGQIFQQQKRNAYGTYRQFWADERSRSEAQPYLDDARRYKKTAEICTYSGLALLLVDACLYSWRQRAVKHKQRTYDRFCKPGGLSWRFEPTAPGPAGPQLGICLTASF